MKPSTTEFVFITRKEYDRLNDIKQRAINNEEWALLIEHKELIQKYLSKVAWAIQTDVWSWAHRWMEQNARNMIIGIQKASEWLNDFEAKFLEFNLKKEAERKED